ncbi:ATP-binding protein [Pseudooceanicola sp. C21-150M6]|uniref:two-component system sensor histidine kinase NtrB n=1 Tax=Pseudooceanicola sp. C21-150M6 TaxID=3434355 RepID=UPI003D7F47EC
MVPTTAVAFLGLALSQLTGMTRRRAVPVFVLATVAVTILVGILTHDFTGAPSQRVSVATMLALGLLAGAQISVVWHRLLRRRLHSLLSALSCLIGFAGCGSYAIGVEVLQEGQAFAGLSLLTSICIVLMGLSMAFAHPVSSWISPLFGDGPGSRSARRRMPLLLGATGGALAIAVVSIERSYMSAGVAMMLFASAIVFLLVMVLLIDAAHQNHLSHLSDMALRRMRAVLSGLDLAVLVIDPRQEVIFANAAAERRFGQAPDLAVRLQGMRVHRLDDRAPLTGDDHPYRRALAGETGALCGWMDEAGQERVLRFDRYAPEEELPGHIVLAIHEVTEIWGLHSRMLMVERVNAVRQVVGGVAHELANIFGVIRLAMDGADLLEGKGAEATQSAIRTASDRGARLADRMLDMSRVQEGSGGNGDLTQAIKAGGDLALKAMPPDISLVCKVPDQPLPVRGTQSELDLAILNLILNARNAIGESAAGEGGEVTVRAWVDGDWGVLSVEDNGPGMSDNVLERAREPFFSTRRDVGGTGLGLAIVDGLAQRVGGRLDLEAAAEGGLCVRLWLPISSADTGLQGARDGGDTTEVPRLDGLCLLVVEDDPEFKILLADMLEMLGAEVSREVSASRALERLRSGMIPDLLLTDYVLPGSMDGIALAREAVRLCPGLPVMYQSGYAESMVEEQNRVPGIWLRKPVNLRFLANSILVATGRDQPVGKT